MSDTPQMWYGWLKLFGRWLKLTGPHPDRSTAARALDAAIKERRICIHPRWTRLVAGDQTPRD